MPDTPVPHHPSTGPHPQAGGNIDDAPYEFTLTASATLTLTVLGGDLRDVIGDLSPHLAAAIRAGGCLDNHADTSALIDALKRDGFGHFHESLHVTRHHIAETPDATTARTPLPNPRPTSPAG